MALQHFYSSVYSATRFGKREHNNTEAIKVFFQVENWLVLSTKHYDEIVTAIEFDILIKIHTQNITETARKYA